MNGLIWKVQKSFFTAIGKNQDIIDLAIPVYGNSVNISAVMPYILILSIKISNIDNLQDSRKNVDIKIAIFDNSTSLKKISHISDIVEGIVTTENISMLDRMQFISINKTNTSLVNNLQTGISNISIEYKCIIEITTL